MLKRMLVVAATLAIAGCVASAEAQTVGERLAADEQRIAEGWRQGQFTPPEYNELQGRHANIERDRRQQLAAGGGQFAPGQLQQLLAREEALSNTIYDYRHNGATPAAH